MGWCRTLAIVVVSDRRCYCDVGYVFVHFVIFDRSFVIVEMLGGMFVILVFVRMFVMFAIRDLIC